MTRRVMVVYGTRPEAIKLAPVVARAARVARPSTPPSCVTGQHREMLDQVNCAASGSCPTSTSTLMQPGAGARTRSPRGCSALDASADRRESPRRRASCRATRPRRSPPRSPRSTPACPVGHVEAGLRTRRPARPVPRGGQPPADRQLATCTSPRPTRARRTCSREGVAAGRIVRHRQHRRSTRSTGPSQRRRVLPTRASQALRRRSGASVLVTTHRRESWGAPMRGVPGRSRDVAERVPDVAVVLPLHRNPIVRGRCSTRAGGARQRRS